MTFLDKIIIIITQKIKNKTKCYLNVIKELIPFLFLSKSSEKVTPFVDYFYNHCGTPIMHTVGGKPARFPLWGRAGNEPDMKHGLLLFLS